MKTTSDQEKLTLWKATLITALSLFFCSTVLKRILCAVALCLGASLQEAAKLSGISEKSARKYRNSLDSGDASALLWMAPRGKASKLNGVRNEIESAIDEGQFGTLRQVASMILKKCQVKVSLSRLAKYLKQIGYKKLQSASLPAKADPEEQRGFFFHVLQPLMRLAKQGGIKLYFMDASHFVFGTCRPGALYTKTRRTVRTFSGRVRYNVLGALDYISKKVMTVANETYITSTEVVFMLEKLAAESGGKPVCLVMDNARYQHCKLVMDNAKELGIALLFLPTYSPNLNLIERLWKWVKAEALNAADFTNFTDFKNSINACIRRTETRDKSALDSLIGDKVQLFNDDATIFDYKAA